MAHIRGWGGYAAALVAVGLGCGRTPLSPPDDAPAAAADRQALCSVPAEGPPRILFRVPRPTDDPARVDFYRLPFPNDIRRAGGRLSLAGHPRPDPASAPVDLVTRNLVALEEDARGFGVNQAVYFRASRPPGPAVEGAVWIVDITPGAPEYGEHVPVIANATRPGRYLCPDTIAVRPAWGRPLRGGRTYAAVVTSALADADGNPFGADEDLRALLSDAPPADPTMAAAWDAYQPLRRHLADPRAVPASAIAAAAVFTTEHVEDGVAGLHAAVAAQPPPAVEAIRCGAGAASPCAPGCAPADARFDELQGTLLLPVFQAGTPPFEQPADGGALARDATGAPMVVRHERVCFSLTVPKGSPPPDGWPPVVYAHGTGGGYLSHVEQGVAADLAAGDPGAGLPGLAVLGFDGPLHGTRGGRSSRPVTELVYNVLNPRAARDNMLQGAADLFAVARALQRLADATVPLDRARVALYGHSQGGNTAALAVGYEPLYGTAVLSGTGGTLMLGLLHKRKPVDVPALLPVLLSDPAGEDHPILNLMQMLFDRADAVNFARRIAAEPLPGLPPRHLLHVFGARDTWAPPETQRTFAQAAGLPLMPPVLDDHGLPPVSPPVKTNMRGTAVTALQAQFAPAGYDGHFVATHHPGARRLVRQMLATYARDGVPTVAP